MWLQTSHHGVSAVKSALHCACASTEMAALAAAARLGADCNRSIDCHLRQIQSLQTIPGGISGTFSGLMMDLTLGASPRATCFGRPSYVLAAEGQRPSRPTSSSHS